MTTSSPRPQPGGAAGEAVDVVRAEAVHGSGGHLGLDGFVAEGKVVLDQGAAGHGDRAGGHVVVVPAGVVHGGPADQPDVHVRVAVQRDEDPLVVAVRDMLLPQPWVARDRRGQLGELRGFQVPAGKGLEGQTRVQLRERGRVARRYRWGVNCGHSSPFTVDAPNISRCGFVRRTATAAASPCLRSRASAYGRSVPCTTWSMPSTRATASMPCGP